MFYGPTADSTKILGSIYTSSDVIFTQINNILDPMIASWGRLSTTTSSGVTNQMTATSTSITSLKSSINSYINSIFKLFYVHLSTIIEQWVIHSNHLRPQASLWFISSTIYLGIDRCCFDCLLFCCSCEIDHVLHLYWHVSLIHHFLCHVDLH